MPWKKAFLNWDNKKAPLIGRHALLNQGAFLFLIYAVWPMSRKVTTPDIAGVQTDHQWPNISFCLFRLSAVGLIIQRYSIPDNPHGIFFSQKILHFHFLFFQLLIIFKETVCLFHQIK